jgi:hypothetical protein
LGIVGLVSNDGLAKCVFEQNIGAFQIMSLPRREMKAGGITQCINRGVDLRTQATTTSPDSLFL